MTPTTPERLRVFIDSDVLFAGAASTTGASHLVLQLAGLGVIDAFISGQVRAEVERNLAHKLPAALPAVRTLIETCCQLVPNPDASTIATLSEDRSADPKDAPILAAALAADCAWLLTFNVRDYRPGQSLRVGIPGDFVVRLRELLLGLAGD